MKSENDGNVLDYWKLPNGKNIVKMTKDDGLGDDCDIETTSRSHIGDFILSNSKKIYY